jgi:probable HAF family extracellular repeat protein
MAIIKRIVMVLILSFAWFSSSQGDLLQYNMEVICQRGDGGIGFEQYGGFNNKGQMLGYGHDSNHQTAALLWDSENGFRPLGYPGMLWGINDDGHTIRYSTENTAIYDLAGNILAIMNDLPSSSSVGAGSINNADQVVGTYWTDHRDLSTNRAFIWDSTKGFRELDGLEPFMSSGTAINNVGQVVGFSMRGAHSTSAFLWTENGGVQFLGTLLGDVVDGLNESYAWDINDAEQVVGESIAWPGNVRHAFIWDKSHGMCDIGTLGDDSYAKAINEAGWVVGCSNDSLGVSHGFLWNDTIGMTDLSNLLSSSYQSYQILNAYDINDSGQIAALANYNNNQYYVLLTPIPEPGTLAMLLLGGLGVMRRGRAGNSVG